MARRRGEAGPSTESFLPLRRETFHIPVSLADQDRHGYAVMQDILERTNGALRLSPGTLYATIRRLLEDGLIAELDQRPDPAGVTLRERATGFASGSRPFFRGPAARPA